MAQVIVWQKIVEKIQVPSPLSIKEIELTQIVDSIYLLPFYDFKYYMKQYIETLCVSEKLIINLKINFFSRRFCECMPDSTHSIFK